MFLFSFDERFRLLEDKNLTNPYKKGGIFRWKGDRKNCSLVLDIISVCENKNQLFIALRLEKNFFVSKNSFIDIIRWDLEHLLFSLLFFFFESQNLEEKESLVYSNYNKIIYLMVCPVFSDNITLLLNHNNFLERFKKNTEIISLVLKLNFLFHVNFKDKGRYLIVIKNCFKIFEIEPSDLLAERVFTEQNPEWFKKFIEILPIYITYRENSNAYDLS